LLPLKYLAKHTKYNLLRVSPEEEEHGIDYYNHHYLPPGVRKEQVLDTKTGQSNNILGQIGESPKQGV